MNSRKRLLKALDHQEADRIPLDLGSTQVTGIHIIAYHRLRQALGQEVVLFDEDCYRFNRELDYAYDVESFQAKLADTEPDPVSQVANYDAAIQLYKGPYLPEADAEWAWWQRESPLQ